MKKTYMNGNPVNSSKYQILKNVLLIEGIINV